MKILDSIGLNKFYEIINSRFLPLVGGTLTGDVFLSYKKSIIQNTSGYTSPIEWYKNGTSQNVYDPQIGQNITGGNDGTGSITILPYATNKNPWGGEVGLLIAKNKLLLDGKQVYHSGNLTSLPANGGNSDTVDGYHASSFMKSYGLFVKSGEMLYKDPYFKSGSNSTIVYNNENNGTVAIERISRTSTNPFINTSYELRIKNTGSSSPGCGGFCFSNKSRVNAIFIYRIIANIPNGRNIQWSANEYGNNAVFNWLTPQAGTGRYTEYICRVQCGNSGTFSSIGYFFIDGEVGSSSNPVYWHVAYATCYDVTNDESSVLTADSCSGNSNTASTLATPRTIWGKSFDGSANISGSMTGVGSITMTGDILQDNKSALKAKNASGNYETWIYPRYSDNMTYLTYGSAGFLIRNNSNVNTMFMDNNNKVGIGTTNPIYKLDVNGTLGVADDVTFSKAATIKGKLDTIGNITITNTNPTLYLSTGRYSSHISCGADGSLNMSGSRVFIDNNTEIDGTLTLWGTLTAEEDIQCVGGITCESYITAYAQNTTSDANLKDITKDFNITTEQIADAPSVEFKWKSNGNVSVGSIAQYWKDICPQAVHEINDHLTMQYDVIALLSSISNAKELLKKDKEIQSLKEEINDLKKCINNINDKLKLLNS